jgi:hypothetical protein
VVGGRRPTPDMTSPKRKVIQQASLVKTVKHSGGLCSQLVRVETVGLAPRRPIAIDWVTERSTAQLRGRLNVQSGTHNPAGRKPVGKVSRAGSGGMKSAAREAHGVGGHARGSKVPGLP